MRFAKLKIIADYRLILHNHMTVSDKILSWAHSAYRVDITNDINFGLQLRTCLTPFHEVYPAQIINVKFESLIIYASQKITKTILKLIAIYEHGGK